MGPGPPPPPPLAVGENHTNQVVVVVLGFACRPGKGQNLLGGWVPNHPLVAVPSPGKGQNSLGGLVPVHPLVAQYPWRQVDICRRTSQSLALVSPSVVVSGVRAACPSPPPPASPKDKQIHDLFHRSLFPSCKHAYWPAPSYLGLACFEIFYGPKHHTCDGLVGTKLCEAGLWKWTPSRSP